MDGGKVAKERRRSGRDLKREWSATEEAGTRPPSTMALRGATELAPVAAGQDGLMEKRRRLEGSSLGIGVREAIYEELEMGVKTCQFGIVSDAGATAFWEWAVPAGGSLMWIWGINLGDAYRERFGKDVWRGESVGLDRMAPVDVVLFEGSGPRPTHKVWTSLEARLNTIVWFDGNRRCRPPLSSSAPSTCCWLVEKVGLHHSALGGVTSISSNFWVAQRRSHGSASGEEPEPT